MEHHSPQQYQPWHEVAVSPGEQRLFLWADRDCNLQLTGLPPRGYVPRSSAPHVTITPLRCRLAQGADDARPRVLWPRGRMELTG